MKRTLIAIITLLTLHSWAFAQTTSIDVKKTASCGCCALWIDKLKQSGFSVRPQNMAMGQLMSFKKQHGIGAKTASCHTGRVAGYTIEGHVPVREIKRLLAERPDAIGLTVPGMPLGSPGMEMGGTAREAYDVLLIKKDGTTEVFAHYSAKQ